MSDPAKYRTKEEVAKMREQHDPIDHLKATLIEEGLATEEAMTKLDNDIRQRVSAAAEFAQKSPEPDPGELWTDITVEA
jgi:pyruvate dehydrogenase E1 component alpha subunit